jgi:hypothetical protein
MKGRGNNVVLKVNEKKVKSSPAQVFVLFLHFIYPPKDVKPMNEAELYLLRGFHRALFVGHPNWEQREIHGTEGSRDFCSQ